MSKDKVKLSPESYADLLEAERRLTSVLGEMDTAEKCGINCDSYRQTLRNQLAEIANMKLHYGPK